MRLGLRNQNAEFEFVTFTNYGFISLRKKRIHLPTPAQTEYYSLGLKKEKTEFKTSNYMLNSLTNLQLAKCGEYGYIP